MNTTATMTSHKREANLRADRNADDLEHVARFPYVRDAAIFVGNPADVTEEAFGPGQLRIRDWTDRNFSYSGYPSADLARIAVPTTLIWGRHDLATGLSIAEAASARYGWPLQVIEHAADEPPIEQPETFVRALRAALGSSLPLEKRSKP